MSHQSSNSNAVRNLVLILVAVAVLTGGAFAIAAFILSADDPTIHPSVSSTSAPEAAPNVGINLPLVQMNGVWRSEKEDSGSSFVATVKNRTMTIEFGDDTTTMVYWYGTFVAEESPGTTITSTAIDTNLLVMSQDKSKDFELRDDVLWFKFSAMGMTKKVALQRA